MSGSPSKIRFRTAESQAVWDAIGKAAEEVAAWPHWKRWLLGLEESPTPPGEQATTASADTATSAK